MTYVDFLKQVEDYYGTYSSDTKKMLVMAYLKSVFSESELLGIWQTVLLKHSDVYKTPPGIKEFKDILSSDDRMEEQAILIWNELTEKVNTYKGIVIEDVRVQAALENMGGWIWFCQRNLESEVWHKKDFVKWFIYYTKNPPVYEQKVLRGINTDEKYIAYGDIDVKSIKGICDNITNKLLKGKNDEMSSK